jgi:hypothetical protein
LEFRYRFGLSDALAFLAVGIVAILLLLKLREGHEIDLAFDCGAAAPIFWHALRKLIVEKHAVLKVDSRGIEYSHPVFHWMDKTISWDQVESGWWAKTFWETKAVLRRKSGTEEIYDLARWRLSGETAHKDVTRCALFQRLNLYVRLEFKDKLTYKGWRRQRHIQSIELGKAAGWASYAILGVMVVALVLVPFLNGWMPIGNGVATRAIVTVALISSLSIGVYLGLKHTPIPGVILIMFLYAGVTAFLFVISIKVAAIALGNDRVVLYRLADQSKDEQRWRAVDRDDLDIHFVTRDESQQIYREIGFEIPLRIREGLCGVALLSGRELNRVRRE